MRKQGQRSSQKEQLDDLNLSGNQLHQTLDELALINKFLGNYQAIRKAIFNVISKSNQSSFQIIDIGCGGGDVLVFLAKLFRKKGIQASFLGIDGNENSLNYARQKAVDFPEIQFKQDDLLADTFHLPKCDLLITSHFIYHFDNQQVISFLQKHSKQIKLAFLASELERNSFAFWLFKLFSPFLNFSKMTKEDGALAIRRAFTKQELTTLLKKANIGEVVLKRRVFFRLMVTVQQS